MPTWSSSRRPFPPRRRRGAYSLIEVVASIGLMAATLVPAMELVRTGLEKSAEDDARQLLALYAVTQVEQRLAPAADAWTNTSYSGDYAADGHANLRYSTTCSDAVVDGGIVGALMSVSTTVYDDANGDDALTAGEMRCSYRTKIGKYATYQNIAL